MATVFQVLYGQQQAGLGLTGLNKEYTAAEVEELTHGEATHKCIITGPVEVLKKITIEAESEAEAAKIARSILRASQYGEKFVTVSNANYKETSAA